MKKSISFLPKNKQQELEEITRTICKYAKIEMLILFGSYARNTWVEDRKLTRNNVLHEYESDYDILAITDTAKRAQAIGTWDKINRIIERNPAIQTWVNIISHDINDINEELERGQYFFCDIKTEGIILYDSGQFHLSERRKLSAQEQRQLAENDFNYWFNSAKGYFSQYLYAVKEKQYCIAAFSLHQAVERTYAAALLVFTAYKPRTHNLYKLGCQAANIDPRLYSVFPQSTTEEKRLFKLLSKSYIDARYKKSFQVKIEELTILENQVRKLHDITKEICGSYIDRLA